jgi:hypothetical protein
MSVIGGWLSCVRRDLLVHHLPETVNYDLLFRAIAILLTSEHHQVLVSTLTFVYRYVIEASGTCIAQRTDNTATTTTRHMCMLPPAQRIVLIDDILLDQSFYRLFLHWCEDVRFVFHYVLAFQVRRESIVHSLYRTPLYH